MHDEKALYNEDLSRRSFLGTAAATAGAAALAAGAEAQDLKALQDPKVRHLKVTFKNGSDTIDGYLARPAAAGTYAGVLVIPGIFGVTEYMRESAAQLAQSGFAALAVNLFSRTPEHAGLQDFAQLRPLVDRIPDPQILGDCQAAIDFLKQQSYIRKGGVGAVGFCMGGRYTLLLAATSPDVAAAAPYYGPLIMLPNQTTPSRPAAPLDVVRQIRVPVQGHYGATDPGIPVADVQQFEKALRDQGTTADMIVYNGAGHAFHDYSRPSFKVAAARQAWNRTMEFFRRHLNREG